MNETTALPHPRPELGDESLRLFIENVRDYGIYMIGPDGRIATWNVGAQRIKGYAAEEVIGRHFRMFFPPEDAAASKPELALQLASDTGKYEERGWRIRKDGSRFFAHVVITAVRDPTGRLRGFGKVTRDVTEQKRAEERQKALANELNHRVKNTLATVQSFVRQTLRGEGAARERRALEDRLLGLSRTHNLLTDRHWEKGSLEEVLRTELSPFEPPATALVIDGPDVEVSADVALALGMAAFELASNAASYGAWRASGGQIRLSWSLTSEGLTMEWRETATHALAPPGDAGIGLRLLTRGLPRQLGGAARLSFGERGLTYVIAIPKAAL